MVSNSKNRLFLERRMVPLGASGPKPPWCVFLGQILADPSNPTAISYNQLLASGAFHAVVKTLLRQSSWIPESLLSVISRVFEPGRRHWLWSDRIGGWTNHRDPLPEIRTLSHTLHGPSMVGHVSWLEKPPSFVRNQKPRIPKLPQMLVGFLSRLKPPIIVTHLAPILRVNLGEPSNPHKRCVSRDRFYPILPILSMTQFPPTQRD